MSDRLFPKDAEEAVLGGILIANDNLGKLALTPEEFFFPRHRAVYRAMQALAESKTPIDVLTLERQLTTTPNWALDGNLNDAVGGAAYLAQLELRVPTRDAVQHYAKIVKESAALRQLQKWAGHLGDAAGRADTDSLREMLQAAPDLLECSERPGTLADVPRENFRPGLPSGIGIEKYVPGGIPRDKVTCIFGDTGNFKSTVKNSILFSLARNGYKCLDVSLEDSSSLTVARYLAQKHSIPYGQIASGQVAAPALDEGDKEILSRIVDGTQVRAKMLDIVALARKETVDAVFLDYVQLLDGCSAEHTELAEAVRLAQRSAALDGIAYILVSQVKQDVRYRSTTRDKSGRPLGDPRASIRDTFGSAAISTGAKLGLSVFRPWAYCPAPTSTSGPVGKYCEWINNHTDIDWAMSMYPRILEVIVDKNVLGPAGPDAATVRVQVDPATGLITELNL